MKSCTRCKCKWRDKA